MILSGSGKSDTISFAYTLGIVNHQNKKFELENDNIDNLRIKIKNFYRQLYQGFSKKESQNMDLQVLSASKNDFFKAEKNPYYKNRESIFMNKKKRISVKTSCSTDSPLLVSTHFFQSNFVFCNGQIIEMIFSDNFLKNHFLFLIFLVKSFIGYNFDSESKEMLVKNIQQELSTIFCIGAFGNSLKDIQTFEQSNISFQLMSRKKSAQQNLLNSSIEIQSLSQISTLYSVKWKQRFLSLFYCLSDYVSDMFWLKIIQISSSIIFFSNQTVLLHYLDFVFITILSLQIHLFALLFSKSIMKFEVLNFKSEQFYRKVQRKALYGVCFFIIYPFIHAVFTILLTKELDNLAYFNHKLLNIIVINEFYFYKIGKVINKIYKLLRLSTESIVIISVKNLSLSSYNFYFFFFSISSSQDFTLILLIWIDFLTFSLISTVGSIIYQVFFFQILNMRFSNGFSV